MVRLYLREKAKTSLILLLYTGSSLTRRYAGLINLEIKKRFRLTSVLLHLAIWT